MKIIFINLVYILAPFIIIFLFQKYKIIKQIGTVIVAYAVGIIMAITGFMPLAGGAGYEEISAIQKMVQNLTIPLAIPLMLFNCDFRLWTRSLPKTLITLIGGLLSVIIAVVLAFFLLRPSGPDDIHNVAAMMVGFYTGGTMNFYALGSILHVNPETILFTYTFEVLVTFPFIMFIVGGGYKFFRKILPFKDPSTTIDDEEVVLQESTPVVDKKGRTLTKLEDIEENGIENYSGIFKGKTFGGMMLGLLLSILLAGVGAGISLLITGKLDELVIILTITTLAILASFNEKVRNLPKTFELGMFFILIFSVVVASQFDIYSINMSSLSICLFILFVLVVSVLLHLLFSWIGKVPGDLFTVAHIGLLCSPPFIPPIVGAMKNKKVLISGIVIGLVGYAVGTYLGVLLSHFFKLFV